MGRDVRFLMLFSPLCFNSRTDLLLLEVFLTVHHELTIH